MVSKNPGHALYWTCWICAATGGYEHSTSNSYAGDVSQLLFADREFLLHRLREACAEIGRRVHGERAPVPMDMSLKDLVRGKGLEHLRGCITGFAVFRIASFFETAMQPLDPEEEVVSLG